jgi:hypothetical protein
MVTSYPVAGKPKSWNLCLAFARGCGGQISGGLKPGPAAFYGVNHSNEAIWRAVLADGRDRYMIDNSYFDALRQRSFRITKNRMQHDGTGESDGARWRAIGVNLKPWRTAGSHIVVCPQSDSFMALMGHPGDWVTDVMRRLAQHTDREIRVRPWSRNKTKHAASLQADLAGAHAVVVWSSAAAVAAVLAGVPVVVEGDDCAAKPMSGTLEGIENLPTPERENWCGVLADNEWTMDEITNGTAWSHLTR